MSNRDWKSLWQMRGALRHDAHVRAWRKRTIRFNPRYEIREEE